MSSPPGAAHDPLQAWLEATAGEVPSGDAAATGAGDVPSVSRRLLRTAGAACVVTLGLGMLTWSLRHTPPSAAPLEAASQAAIPAASPAGEAGLATPAVWPSATDPAAVAVIALRMAAPEDLYVDTAVAESLRELADATIVTVRAVVLDRMDDHWGPPRPARYAVAVSTAADIPTVLGSPWPLPVQDAPPVSLQWQATPALTAAATQALHQAGYRDTAAITVRRTPHVEGAVNALCRAIAPGESVARRHEVWLTPDASQVIGTAGQRPGLPVPQERP